MTNSKPVTIERTDVPSATSDRVADHLGQKRSCLVRGAVGSGKSHAVRKAVNGAVWVDLAPRPFTVPMFVTALAHQLGEDSGRAILQACAVGDTRGSLEQADAALADRVLVIDGAEHIARSSESAFEDPTETMFVSEAQDLTAWIRARTASRAMVVITSRRLPQFDVVTVDHEVPKWPVKLTDSMNGFYRWKEAAELLANHPAGLQVAATTAQLVDAKRFNDAVDDLQWSEEPTPGAALATFAEIAVEAMSSSWRRALAVHAAIEGAPRALRDEILAMSPDLQTATQTLSELRLIDTERGFVHVNSALANHPALTQAEGAPQVLRDAARYLQDGVNDASALDPRNANAIFLAHRLFVRLGDFDSAARTARLHRGGLIALARLVSLDGQWDEARRLYERTLAMLPSANSKATCRTRSYVVHYRAYNGHRARTLPNAEVLAGYKESTDLWSDNALWWKRRLCLLVELGRLDEFRSALDVADQAVPPHKRKDGLLKVPAARQALEVGATLLSLELVAQANTADDPVGESLRAELIARWEQGIEIDRLESGTVSIILNRPTAVQIRYVREGAWQARGLERSTMGATAADAFRALVDDTCQHIRHLVETPTHLLDDGEVLVKRRMIGEVDLGASELGLWAARERWLLGRRSNDVFRPAQAELGTVELPLTLRGDDIGLFFARVPVTTDGRPSGPVEELVSAGSGRRLDELLGTLKSLRSAG